MQLAQELVTDIQCSGGSRSFAKESLKNEELSGWPSKTDNNQLRAITKADLKTTQEVAQELNVNHSLVIWYFKQIGKKEKLNKWVPHELTCVLSLTLQLHGLEPIRPSVYGILEVRILESVAMPFSRVSSWPRDWTCISYISCICRQVLYH